MRGLPPGTNKPRYMQEMKSGDFHASNSFVYDFKRRNGFRSRRAHVKR
jgi:hypothetical protein